jgi:hypothetical protein
MAFASNKNMNDIAMDVEINSDAVDADEAVGDVITVTLQAFTAALTAPYSSNYAMGHGTWGII